LKEKKWRC